jgi:hypothetical protein
MSNRPSNQQLVALFNELKKARNNASPPPPPKQPPLKPQPAGPQAPPSWLIPNLIVLVVIVAAGVAIAVGGGSPSSTKIGIPSTPTTAREPSVREAFSDPTRKLSYIEDLRQITGDRAVPTTSSKYEAAGRIIRASGYDCPEVNLLVRWIFSEGFDAYCRDGRYKFELANHGGIWTVTPP